MVRLLLCDAFSGRDKEEEILLREHRRQRGGVLGVENLGGNIEELEGDTEAGLHVRRLLRLRGYGIAVHSLVEGAPGVGVPGSLSHHPSRVVGQVRLPNMPTGLYEHCLEGVHADAVVRAVPRWMHVVVAAPVSLVSPVQVCRVPASPQVQVWVLTPHTFPGFTLDSFFSLPCSFILFDGEGFLNMASGKVGEWQALWNTSIRIAKAKGRTGLYLTEFEGGALVVML